MAGQNTEPETMIARAFVQQARELLKDQYLPKLERCMETLNDEQIWWRPNEDSNSIGNLLLHLSGNARQWIISGLGGAADNRVRQREFDERAIITRAELRSLLRQTLAEVDAILEAFDLTTILQQKQIQGTAVTALEAIFHVTEHFSMHAGQIIILTKMLTSSDLRFYDFEAGAPIERWRSGPSGSL